MKMKAICLRTIMAAGGGLFLLLGASPPPPAGAEISELGKRINAFTFDVLRQSAGAEDAAPNTILSPQSIYHGLAMNYVASGGGVIDEPGMVSVNAIYFKGNWQDPFEATNTREWPFRLMADQSTPVQVMIQTRHYRSFETPAWINTSVTSPALSRLRFFALAG